MSGTQFTQDVSFKTYVLGRFLNECHAATFGGETGLTALFESAVCNPTKRKRGNSFFDVAEAFSDASSSSGDQKRLKGSP